MITGSIFMPLNHTADESESTLIMVRFSCWNSCQSFVAHWNRQDRPRRQSNVGLALLRTNPEQVFRYLGWTWAEICLKCFILLTNFQKSQALWLSAANTPLTVDFGDLKLHGLAKLCFSNWLWRNRTSKNRLCRHLYYVIEKNVPKQFLRFFSIFGPLPIKIYGYVSEIGMQRKCYLL